MKTNEAPEKIYIPTILAANTVIYKIEGSIEYTRTDAFIEKACEWIEKNIAEATGIDSYAITESFKRAMEE